MKQIISALRLTGTICLLAFIIAKLANIYPTVATAAIVLSITCFAIIILMQLYYHYIARYKRETEEENN